MALRNSYFALGDLAPARLIDRALHPYRPLATVEFRAHPLRIEWTRRAERALARRGAPLHVAMQLYFSCVVKKRVLFHDETGEGAAVRPDLTIGFHAVEAASCDPVEFARHYPARQELTSQAAGRMRPSLLQLDYRDGEWRGRFEI